MTKRILTPLSERFWRHVRIVDDADSCWPWQGSIRRNGYGYLSLGRRADGTIGAHQIAWFLTHGKLPVGREVMHRCDNHPCVRPSHLLLGTKLENMRDMVMKKRDKNSKKVACHRGHPLIGDNLLQRAKGGVTRRQCRECTRVRGQAASKRYKMRKKERAA